MRLGDVRFPNLLLTLSHHTHSRTGRTGCGAKVQDPPPEQKGAVAS